MITTYHGILSQLLYQRYISKMFKILVSYLKYNVLKFNNLIYSKVSEFKVVCTQYYEIHQFQLILVILQNVSFQYIIVPFPAEYLPDRKYIYVNF